MINATYFISDAHLGMKNYPYKREQEDMLISFFDKIIADKAKELFIVGDFFDSWIEYRQVVPKGFYRIFSKLYDLVNSNVKITYLAGNHDFWRGNYLYDEFGIEMADSQIERIIDGKKFYIHHGDGLAYKDAGYRIMKKILRNRLSQFLYSWIHPDVGLWLAKSTSSKSRDYTSQKDYSVKDGLKDRAMEKITEGYDFVIMGHRHKPVFLKDGNGVYVNLGDWMKTFSYGVFSDGIFYLNKYYDLENHKIIDELIADSKA